MRFKIVLLFEIFNFVVDRCVVKSQNSNQFVMKLSLHVLMSTYYLLTNELVAES